MKYRLRRNRALAFQNFKDSLDRAEKNLPELESNVIPHYSDWYDAESMQDLANKLEFKSEAEGEDEVFDESGGVVGHIAEEMCMPVLVDGAGVVWMGPELRGEGDVSTLCSEEYAKKMVTNLFKKEN